jgi:NAD(P)-dependent dehydrogenase (short-subunit alcohol dehydrogenase family)
MADAPRSAHPDLSGQIMVITGGNSGIGKEAAVELAGMGATVIITARDEAKGAAALAEIRSRSGRDDAEVLALDLADFASIRAMAAQVLERYDRLDVLINNAGGVLSTRLLTAQGFEMTFGVNHLGHFLLTELLTERLVASAPARVVTLSSVGHRFALGGLSFTDLQSEHGYWSMDAYSKSKLANILFTRELARRLEGTGVTANCAHPGVVRTGFGSADDTRGIERVTMVVSSAFSINAARGARTTVFLASSPEVAGRTGGYYVRNRLHSPSKAARDDESARRLWEVSQQLIDSVEV